MSETSRHIVVTRVDRVRRSLRYTSNIIQNQVRTMTDGTQLCSYCSYTAPLYTTPRRQRYRYHRFSAYHEQFRRFPHQLGNFGQGRHDVRLYFLLTSCNVLLGKVCNDTQVSRSRCSSTDY